MPEEKDASSTIKTIGGLLLREIEGALSAPHASLSAEAQKKAIRTLTDVNATNTELLRTCEVLYGAYRATVRSQAATIHFREELNRLARLVAAESRLDTDLRIDIRDLAHALMREPKFPTSSSASDAEPPQALIDAIGCRVSNMAPVNIMCRRTDIVALLGDNGSGKSSILRLLAGHSSYALCVDLHVATATSRRLVEDRISRPTTIVWGTLLTTAKLAAPPGTTTREIKEKMLALLDRLGLQESEALQQWSTLSDGQAKRFALAQAICTESDVVLIDEPMANLDARAEIKQRNALTEYAQSGKSVILSAQRSSVTAGWTTRSYTLRGERAQKATRWECEIAGRDTAALVSCLEELLSRHGLRILREDEAEVGVLYIQASNPNDAVWHPHLQHGIPKGAGYRWILNLPVSVTASELCASIARAQPYLFSVLTEDQAPDA